MNKIDIPKFIKKSITKRSVSMFSSDVENNKNVLFNRIKNKSVLVIGGAGTIGSSFIKEILKFKPSDLVVVDINENGLTELTRDLRSEPDQYLPKRFLTYPMNFGDKSFFKMFKRHGPFDIVANFAAHKHVRSEKDEFSIESMIENNILKAKCFLDFLLVNKPEHFFCVSTDKAANPVNVMGASKKLMEEVIMAFSDEIKITTARFANVAFSNGSLLAGYLKRLDKYQAISCPSDVKRFFVSPEESGQICLLACILGKSSEIFYPKLKQSDLIAFREITESFLGQLGLTTIHCKSEKESKLVSKNRNTTDPYPVYYFKSETSGEKLYEEFYSKSDFIDEESFFGLGVIKNAIKPSKLGLENLINELKKILNSKNYNKASIIEVMKKYLPSFSHIEKGKNLDHKM